METMGLRWVCDGFAMGLRWVCDGSAMGLITRRDPLRLKMESLEYGTFMPRRDAPLR
jgi:hypothetical protein